MFILYVLIGVACFIALSALFDRYYLILLPPKRRELFLIFEGEIPNIEAMMRELYAFLRHRAWFEPVIVNDCRGESAVILQKLCQSYALRTRVSTEKYAGSLHITAYSSTKELKKQISLLRTEIELPEHRARRNA